MWLFIVLVCILVCVIDWLRRIPRVTGLHKKCVVITGCDSGFGNALAKSLYNKGVYVFAGCFTEPGAKKLTEETGERLTTFVLDVSKTDNIEKAYDFVTENLPRGTELWGLVNNAGTPGERGPCEIISRQDMLNVMNINCFGMAEMVRVFLPLIKQSRGRIVNTASAGGVIALPGVQPYFTSKFAVMGYSQALRYEKAIWGITVSTICPGTFNTPIIDMDQATAGLEKKWEAADPVVKDEYGKEYFDIAFKKFMESLPMGAASNLSPVVNAYEHALFARHPRHVYYPGWDGWLVIKLNQWCPWLVDFMLYNGVKLNMPKALAK